MSRATTPVVGLMLMTVVTIALAAAVGVTAIASAPPTGTPPVALTLTATADGHIGLVHEGGPSLDVRELEVTVLVDGTPIAEQPPVPFFAAVGFRSGPTGPFNAASDPEWSVGERAGFHVAATNDPALRHGVTVTVRLSRDELPVAILETRVGQGT